MMRFIRTFFGAVAMIAVMLLAAALTLRIALHGHEVTVPDFAGKSSAEASDAALNAGLDLTIENKFYSTTVPAGRMLSQAPAPGSRVRHGWQVRVTQSLGPQQVTIPDVAGEPVREATMNLRRKSLDLGVVAHLEAPGDPDMVLAQTPPPNAGVDQPKVSLLLSSASSGASTAMVMPSLIGMSYSAANHVGMALGLRVYFIADTPPPPAAPPPTPSPTPQAGADIPTPVTPAAPATPSGPVTAQKPEPGSRVLKGESVRITFGHPSTPATAAPAATGSSSSPSTTP
ncbi:MAG TPA: PASTA domain-containing protein [Acidobacteriaceae bacterium]|jgi:beta-lactam-binding protein with PASTA domain